MTSSQPLDRFDLALLELLQGNNQLTYAEMAERVHLSESACRRRVRSLRDSGAITADVSVVSPEVMGRPLVIVMLISLKHESHEVHGPIRRFFHSRADVLDCSMVTGSADYVVKVALRSMKDYEHLCETLTQHHPAVKRIESLIVMKQVTRRTAIPPAR